MNYLPLFIFIILSTINIKTRMIEKNKTAAITKLTLAPTALTFILINTSFDPKTRALLIIAYSFYLVGDTFLLFQQTKLFAVGLTSFLFGHICFTIIFINNRISFTFVPFVALALIYPFYKMMVITKNLGKLKLPMRLYSLMMVLFISLSTLMNNPFLLIGTAIFTLSDSFIARNTSYNKKIFSEFHIMGTYTLALILLATGMIYYQMS